MPPLVLGELTCPPATLLHRCLPLRLAPTARSPSPGGKRQQELVNRARRADPPQETSSLLISEPAGPYHTAVSATPYLISSGFPDVPAVTGMRDAAWGLRS